MPALAVDADSDSIETYRFNFGEVAVCADVRRLVYKGLDADAVIAGVPCQGFLPLTRRSRRRDLRNGLFWEVLRALKEIRPGMFAVENVPQFLDWWSSGALISGARKLGYEVETRVMNAFDYGVPQVRRRAILLGSLNDEVSWPVPLPSRRRKTVREAIGDLPAEIPWQGMDRTTHCGRKVMKRIESIPIGGSRRDIPKGLLPPCWRRHTTGTGDVMGRLSWDKPSVSIRTEFIKPEKGRYLHPEANRPITLREGARLQSFRDGFRFSGSMTSIARQIGNAVPPELAYGIAQAMRKSL